MAVPASGELKLWDTLWNQELGGTKGENSLHSASVYAGFSTPDALSDFYGWSDVEVPTVTTYSSAATTYNSICTRVCVNATGNEDPTYGVYFGTNSGGYALNTKYTGGTGGVGLYCILRSSLSYATTYYWWGWACNSAGEAVGLMCAAGTPYPPFTPQFVNSSGITGAGCSGAFVSHFSLSSAYQNAYTSGWNAKCSASTQTSYNQGGLSFGAAQISSNSLNYVVQSTGPSGLPWDGLQNFVGRNSIVRVTCTGGGLDTLSASGNSGTGFNCQLTAQCATACSCYIYDRGTRNAIVYFCH